MIDSVERLYPLLPPLRLLLFIGEDTEGKSLVRHHVVVSTPYGGTVLRHFSAELESDLTQKATDTLQFAFPVVLIALIVY